MADYSKHVPLAKRACAFLTASPDPFHAVKNCVEKLRAADFSELCPKEPFAGKISPGGKYYYTLNDSTIAAFAVGERYEAGNGFKVIGGHTDSPNLKVKPRSKREGSGCVQLGVECYGGGLWHTWFDRDLGVSGRVLVRKDGKIETRLVKIDTPVARVSTLCIHLQSAEEREAFKVNKEDHMSPIVATLEERANDQLTSGHDDAWTTSQEPLLLNLLAQHLQVAPRDIADFQLNLFDTQPASLGGIRNEFLYSARLDNLATCFVSIEALIQHSALLAHDDTISAVVLFDHEEVGSETATGAGSPIMLDAVTRVSAALAGRAHPDLLASTLGNSFIFSVDMAHAVHPNYAAKHENNHKPKLNAGVAIKLNSNQRYATDSKTAFIVREICRKAKLNPVQDFVVRNDCPCGSTIGPIISANTGIRTVDAGMPQLSMHSCREVMGIADCEYICMSSTYFSFHILFSTF